MKTERRHELERNQLANSIGHWADAVRPYINAILVGILVVVVALAVFFVAQRRSAAGNAKAWDDYFVALARLDRLKLEDVGENNAGTPVGWWALCMAAELGLDEGSNQLFRDKVLAHDILRRAADRYQQVLGEAREPALLKQANFGLARVHECLGEIKKAEDEYQAIVKNWPDTPIALAADKRAKDLKGMEAREFYDWFAKQDIGKRIAPHSSMPGLQSPLNLNSLPDSPDQSGTLPGDDAPAGSSATPDDAPAATTSEPAATSKATADGPSSDAGAKGVESTGKSDAGRQK
jgi:tetratricopeptide (TPR) repeat protein